MIAFIVMRLGRFFRRLWSRRLVLAGRSCLEPLLRLLDVLGRLDDSRLGDGEGVAEV
jgi:hypothetical protein